eukprot:254200-Prorocentrum_lima.AAC.1
MSVSARDKETIVLSLPTGKAVCNFDSKWIKIIKDNNVEWDAKGLEMHEGNERIKEKKDEYQQKKRSKSVGYTPGPGKPKTRAVEL